MAQKSSMQYALDWDSLGRQERIEVLDAGSNAVLDTREVSTFSGGKYLVWNLRGHVKLKVTNLGATGTNAVISGLFFGPVGGSTAASVNWLVADQLGTPRMVFDKTGSLTGTKRHDYLPFGEDIFAGTGSRTTTQGYQTSPTPNDGVRQKFTQKERDIETNLDYFGARYYGSIMGRFTSLDPLSGEPTQPQSWNRYSYVLNNPLKFVDPTDCVMFNEPLPMEASSMGGVPRKIVTTMPLIRTVKAMLVGRQLPLMRHSHMSI